MDADDRLIADLADDLDGAFEDSFWRTRIASTRSRCA
jgi:hypothetical protein